MNITFAAKAASVVTRVAGRASLQLSKYAPEILTGVGLVGGVATVVTAAKATLELKANTAYGLELVKGHKELRAERSEEEYPTRTYAKDMLISYARVASGVMKTYAIPFASGMASGTAILGAVGILRSRNAALSAAYNLVDASYRSYKKKMVEALGEEKESEILAGSREVVLTEDEQKGLTSTELEEYAERVKKQQKDGMNVPYAAWFSPTNPNWGATEELRLFFLDSVEKYMNQKLLATGHLFANDVYRALGCSDTKAGAVTGWLKDSEHGDGFVDLGLDKLRQKMFSPFGNELKNGFWVELNVDGLIYDQLED